MKTTKRKSQPIWSSCVRFPFRQEVCYNNKDNDDTEDYPISSSDDSDEESENEISDDGMIEVQPEISY